MRILFIVPYAPSLIRVRPYQLLRQLAKRGNRVTLATLWSSLDERKSLDGLAGEGIEIEAFRLPAWRPPWNCLRALPTRKPLQAAYCWQPKLAARIREILSTQRVDVVHVEHLRGARYGLAALETKTLGQNRPPLVWDSVDCISDLLVQARMHTRSVKGRLMAWMELSRTRSHEGWLVERFDRTLATSALDRLGLCRLTDQTPGEGAESLSWKVAELPNGVDLQAFRPGDRPRDPATVVFTGKMSYHANITAALHLARDVMPLVWESRPDAELQIVGKDPSREIRALGDVQPSRRIRVTGTVPVLRPYLQRATVAAAPITYGAGIQNKVLEAMACAAPVVASPRAVAALSVRPGEDLLVAEGAAAIAQALLKILESPPLAAKLGSASRTFVEKNHDWNRVAARLEKLYRETIEGRRAIQPHAAA